MLVGLFGRIALAPYDCRVLSIEFLNNLKEGVSGNLWYRKDLVLPAPGVVLVHSYFQASESLRPMALFLARRGFVVLDVTLAPLTPARRPRELKNFTADVEAAIYYLKESALCSDGQISLLGHSLGGNLAALCATTYPNVPAAISIGFPAESALRSPRNLLLGAGVFDELHGPSKMEKALLEATGGAGRDPGITVGKFSEGTARRLVISPYSDHATEIIDPLLMTESVKWLEEGVPVDPLPWNFTELVAAPFAGAFFLGLFLLWVHFYLSLHRGSRNFEGASILRNHVHALFTLVPVPLLGAARYALSLNGYSPWGDFTEELLAIGILGLLVANHIASHHSALLRDESYDPAVLLVRPVKVIGLALGCRIAVALAIALPWLVIHPADLAAALAYIISNPFNILFLVEGRAQLILVTHSDSPLILTAASCVLLALDLLLPGLVLIPIAGFARGVLNTLTQSAVFKLRINWSWGAFALMLALAGTASWMWYILIGNGFEIDRESLFSLALLLLRILAPFALFVAALRSRWSPWRTG
jgi:pimeloyl-ACP methyl ester carboxylesterase